jgi:biotin-dependent carboxylase-like uncharacterized protein
MSGSLLVTRAGPLTTIQDAGRFGALAYGVSASGPVDAPAFASAGAALEVAGRAGIEFTQAGFAFEVADTELTVSFSGGEFALTRNGEPWSWPAVLKLSSGEKIEVAPGVKGNYGYMRMNREVDLPEVLGSLSTSLIAGLGGLGGRALLAGDSIPLGGVGVEIVSAPIIEQAEKDDPIRVVWGLHAGLFGRERREAFLSKPFTISNRLDRMGVRLDDPNGVFDEARILSLVSEAVVPGDVQILGDGTPIILLRDHQPTGGYPRIATVIAADLGRFAQLRPGSECRFTSVTPDHARQAKVRQ